MRLSKLIRLLSIVTGQFIFSVPRQYELRFEDAVTKALADIGSILLTEEEAEVLCQALQTPRVDLIYKG